MLTRVDNFGKFHAKREDLAEYDRPSFPSGAKVRQYNAMCLASPSVPVLVGCSAYSMQQVYCAAAALKFNRKAIIYIPFNKKRSDATEYVIRSGAEVVEIPAPCFPSVYRKRARDRAQEIGGCVRWSSDIAIKDTMEQVQNLPQGINRIIVPTGSGLTAAAILAGCVKYGINAKSVVAYSFSPLADVDTIMQIATQNSTPLTPLPKFNLVRTKMPYKSHRCESLPDGTPLDPFYSAKVLQFVEDGDLIWLTGLRPVCAMPKDCRERFKDWRYKEK